eukprot:GHVS01055270.1.p1 GENE.GHVS01055270.1~~GHVS01055270.1.p1  ORF type:complete len:587 (+),score=71.94 GHVS01055270.1:205-1965(+)
MQIDQEEIEPNRHRWNRQNQLYNNNNNNFTTNSYHNQRSSSHIVTNTATTNATTSQLMTEARTTAYRRTTVVIGGGDRDMLFETTDTRRRGRSEERQRTDSSRSITQHHRATSALSGRQGEGRCIAAISDVNGNRPAMNLAVCSGVYERCCIDSQINTTSTTAQPLPGRTALDGGSMGRMVFTSLGKDFVTQRPHFFKMAMRILAKLCHCCPTYAGVERDGLVNHSLFVHTNLNVRFWLRSLEESGQPLWRYSLFPHRQVQQYLNSVRRNAEEGTDYMGDVCKFACREYVAYVTYVAVVVLLIKTLNHSGMVDEFLNNLTLLAPTHLELLRLAWNCESNVRSDGRSFAQLEDLCKCGCAGGADVPMSLQEELSMGDCWCDKYTSNCSCCIAELRKTVLDVAGGRPPTSLVTPPPLSRSERVLRGVEAPPGCLQSMDASHKLILDDMVRMSLKLQHDCDIYQADVLAVSALESLTQSLGLDKEYFLPCGAVMEVVLLSPSAWHLDQPEVFCHSILAAAAYPHYVELDAECKRVLRHPLLANRESAAHHIELFLSNWKLLPLTRVRSIALKLVTAAFQHLRIERNTRP